VQWPPRSLARCGHTSYATQPKAEFARFLLRSGRANQSRWLTNCSIGTFVKLILCSTNRRLSSFDLPEESCARRSARMRIGKGGCREPTRIAWPSSVGRMGTPVAPRRVIGLWSGRSG
jgi:hypothetical protein